MSVDYVRCHYVNDENGVQCESWHSVAEGPMCAVHHGFVSVKLAANGINKDAFLNKQKELETTMFARLEGLDVQAQANLLSEHIAGLEKKIEELKNEALTYRAGMRHVEEGMSEADRQIRRQMKVPGKSTSVKTPTARIKGTPAQQLKAYMDKYPKMSKVGAMMILGIDEDEL